VINGDIFAYSSHPLFNKKKQFIGRWWWDSSSGEYKAEHYPSGTTWLSDSEEDIIRRVRNHEFAERAVLPVARGNGGYAVSCCSNATYPSTFVGTKHK